MTFAKLSQSAAASLAFVRKLQSPETHTLVKREVFAQAKLAFSIPAEHKVRVELDPGNENYLVLIRKKDGQPYELNGDNKWVGLVEATPREPHFMYVVMNLDDVQQWAAEMANSGDAADVVEAEYVEGDTSPVQLKADNRYVYIKVDASELHED